MQLEYIILYDKTTRISSCFAVRTTYKLFENKCN